MSTEFGYARAADGAYLGYRVDGHGPIDIVLQPDWQGTVDDMWEDPDERPWLEGFASIGRLIVHDHRGIGSSTRTQGLPTLETRVDDLLAVLDAVGAERPVLAGYHSSGSVNALLAATRPELPRAILWMEPNPRYAWAPDYPWGVRWDRLDEELAQMRHWGTPRLEEWQDRTTPAVPATDPSMPAVAARAMCTPDVAAELLRIWFETDVRGLLGSVRVPTLLMAHRDAVDSVARARYLLDRLPQGELREMPGDQWSVGEVGAWLREIRSFLGEDLPPASLDTVLSTVLFTDIVDSTTTQARLGDRGWKDLVTRHHALVRDALQRWGGTENDTAGDGFYATFAGPARAIHCAREIGVRVRDLGIEIRAGIHTGECELIEGKCAGLTVSIGARVASNAGPSEVLVSQTVRDLVAGSGLAFDDAGAHELKGVPGRWQLFRVTTLASELV